MWTLWFYTNLTSTTKDVYRKSFKKILQAFFKLNGIVSTSFFRQEVEIRPVIIKKSWLAPATKTDHWKFTMNKAIYGGTQEEVYREIFHTPLLKAMDGISGFVMLCGRKGTGKSYTSRGKDRHYDDRGIIPRALQQVFREIQARNFEYDIRVR